MEDVQLRIVEAPEGFWGHYLKEEEKEYFKPGDMWPTPSLNNGWAIVLPNMTVWYTTQKVADGTGWDVSGEPPEITVTPSIHDQNPINGWHGWITKGVITTV